MERREIKFRGKNTINGNFVFGFYYQKDGRYYIDSGHTVYPIHPPTVSQFTGLKDEDGVDIYEGDIIEATERRYFFGMQKGLQTIRFRSEVVWDQAGFSYSTTQELDSPLYTTEGIKVIGNIYENPNLLKRC